MRQTVMVAWIIVAGTAAWAPAGPEEHRLWAEPVADTVKIGQTVTFTITSPRAGSAEYLICEDLHVPPLSKGSLELRAGEPTKVTAKLDHAGFVLLRVKQHHWWTYAAAAVEPTNIKSVAKEPADFDQFWKGELNKLKATALNADVSERGDGVRKVVLDSVEGRKVYGWVRVPTGDGPFTTILELPAFGSGKVGPPMAMPGVLTASMSIHGADPEQPATNAYKPANTTDHRTNYYKYAVLAGVRMLDYLTGLPQCDGRRIILTGKSQGGGMSLLIGGLDQRVTQIVACVPSMGQHAGTRHGRSSGFPWWGWEQDVHGNTAKADLILREAEYYDAAHFAGRFAGKATVMVAWQDVVCPPSSVMASCNVMGERVTYIHGKQQGHDWNAHGRNWWTIRQKVLEGLR